VRIVLAIFFCLWATAALAFGHGNAGPAYPCTLMALTGADTSRAHQTVSFTSTAAVLNYYGTGNEATLANTFFTTGAKNCTNPTIKFIRFPTVAGRAHLQGGNVAAVLTANSGPGWTPTTGAVGVTSQGLSWTSSPVTLAAVNGVATIGNALATAINGTNNANLPVEATTTGSTLTPASCTFTGYLSYLNLYVQSEGSGAGSCAQNGVSGGLISGMQVCDTGDGSVFNNVTGGGANQGGYGVNHFNASVTGMLNITAAGCMNGQVNNQQENLLNSPSYLNNNTTQNPAGGTNVQTFSMFLRQGQTPYATYPYTTNAGMTFTAYWSVFTVGTLTSGTIQAGEQLEDTTGPITTGNLCVIWSNISGATSGSGPTGVATGSGGNGSTWLAACADPTKTVAAESVSLSVCAMEGVGTTPQTGATGRAYIEVSISNYCSYYASTINYLSDAVTGGTNVSSQLMLAQGTGTAPGPAFADTPGLLITNGGAGMAAIQAIDPNFGSFVYGITPFSLVSAGIGGNYQGGPALPYGVDPALQAWSQAQPGQWPYYYSQGSVGAGGNFPWAH
jgi:hypothetical protein